MERKPLQSRAIVSAGYDPESRTLELEFASGRIYRYADVPAGTYEWLLRAPSKGGYFARMINERYAYRDVTEPAAGARDLATRCSNRCARHGGRAGLARFARARTVVHRPGPCILRRVEPTVSIQARSAARRAQRQRPALSQHPVRRSAALRSAARCTGVARRTRRDPPRTDLPAVAVAVDQGDGHTVRRDRGRSLLDVERQHAGGERSTAAGHALAARRRVRRRRGIYEWYRPDALVDEGDVVVVNVNYRIGVFGYLRMPGVSPGNLGLLDQIAALRWVRDNIAAFGGDADQVTLFGESAGAHSIVALMSTPDARGLFRRAIAQSPHIGLGFTKQAQAERVARTFARLLGDVDPRTASVAQLLSAQDALQAKIAGPRGLQLGAGLWSDRRRRAACRSRRARMRRRPSSTPRPT